jgi:uncharacterized surface protein with fasciclin (FAS1) repeats
MFLKPAGGKVMLNGVATVTTADIIASNGVVHVVDKVMVSIASLQILISLL